LATRASVDLDDDYIVEGGAKPVRPSVSLRIIRVLQFILVVAIAALSLAMCYLVGLLLGVF
jgi:hypothetical protein